MSVAHQLELDQATDVLREATGRWPIWVREHPVLRATRPDTLRTWLKGGEPGEVDDVLHALVTLASADGGDDLVAARLMAWALLPGATALARRLRALDPDIDKLVASQLWVEIRCFPHHRLRRVAANILQATRCEILASHGSAKHLQRTDRTWSRTRAVDPVGPFWTMRAEDRVAGPQPADELDALLEWACTTEVLTADDRELITRLVQASHEVPVHRVRRGNGGLMANEVSRIAAQQYGVSVRTVRRRTRRALDALTEACNTTDPTVLHLVVSAGVAAQIPTGA